MTTTRTFWDREYAKGFIYGIYPSETAVKAAQVLINKELTGSGVNVVEIGGGYGRNSLYLNQHLGVQAHVIDFSEHAIALGQQLTGGNVTFIHGDVRDLDKLVAEASTDVVFHNFCLHILPEEIRQEIYRDAARVLKPGGLLIGSYLSIDDPDFASVEKIDDYTRLVRGKPQHFFSEEQIRKELKPYFDTLTLIKSCDPERIIDATRNTHYFFVVGERK